MPQHLDQQASNIHTNTEQENSDFLTAPSLLMPLLPARLFKIPHTAPIFPSITHFLQESNLFLTSPHILEAFPAAPAQVSRLQSRIGSVLTSSGACFLMSSTKQATSDSRGSRKRMEELQVQGTELKLLQSDS